jgi:hypothetical protein
MPPCSARSSTSRCRGGLRPCLTGPARGGLPSGRSGQRDGQSWIEHRDGSCGTAFLLEMTGAVVERAEIAQPLQPPGGVVAGNEVADRRPDLGGGAEGSAPDCLLLEGSKEPLDDAIGACRRLQIIRAMVQHTSGSRTRSIRSGTPGTFWSPAASTGAKIGFSATTPKASCCH